MPFAPEKGEWQFSTPAINCKPRSKTRWRTILRMELNEMENAIPSSCLEEKNTRKETNKAVPTRNGRLGCAVALDLGYDFIPRLTGSSKVLPTQL
jgi:hypothetical protein